MSWYSRQVSDAFNSYFLGSSTQISLPTHPNIIKILYAMVEDTPWLGDALQSYPSALPKKIHPDGLGRNKTMCLVMPKYDYTLHKYLVDQKPTNQDKMLILAQLLEGVAHLVENYEAHRDLKADNILLMVDKNCCPRLVITDFGCCLGDRNLKLKLPFESDHIDRGGNSALMAPEVFNSLKCKAFVHCTKFGREHHFKRNTFEPFNYSYLRIYFVLLPLCYSYMPHSLWHSRCRFIDSTSQFNMELLERHDYPRGRNNFSTWFYAFKKGLSFTF